MDRVEFGIKIEQINKLVSNKDYSGAAKVADTVEWRKVKKWSELSDVIDIYEKAERYKEARNICVYAYNRNLGGRRLLYELTELSIMINDLDEADDLYKEFVQNYPKDTGRYILLYKLNKARGVSTDRLIEILEEYKENELEEKYEYELALLYEQAGKTDKCIKECDDLILWFNDGDYVEKALRLKMSHTSLTRAQEAKLQLMEEYRAAGMEYSAVLETKSEDDDIPVKEVEIEDKSDEKEASDEDEIRVPEKDYSLYDTQNIQEELAKSMAVILGAASDDNNDITAEKANLPEEDFKSSEENESEQNINLEMAQPENDQEEMNSEMDDGVSEELIIESDNEEVDEPTKEIRINTHHWNRIVNVMETDEPVQPENEQAAAREEIPEQTNEEVLPKIETETTETFGEAEIGMAIEINELVQTVEDDKETTITEDEKVVKTESEPEKFAEPEEVETTPVQGELGQMILSSEDAPVEGQMDLISWLETIPDETEANSDTTKEETDEFTEASDDADSIETEEVNENITETEENVDENAESEELKDSNTEDAAVTEAINEAMDELTEKLIEEVTEDLAKTEETAALEKVIPSMSPEEEHVITDDENEEVPGILEETECDKVEIDPSQKKYLKKYLFMNGMETSVAKLLNSKKTETRDGTSKTGNIVISGKDSTDKTGFAIGLFKALHVEDNQTDLKIAKTNAFVLNRKGIAESKEKIIGTTLIVEHADRIEKETAIALNNLMEENTNDMLVIFTGEEFAINRLFQQNPKLGSKFDHIIELKKYSVNELVAIAKEYARGLGFVIEDKAMLKLYLLIGENESSDAESEIERVKQIIDRAIANNKHNKKKLFGKKTESVITLKEKNFR